MTNRICTAALQILLAAGPGFCQSQTLLSGPFLGHFWDRDAASLRPIRGIPGASTLGEPITTTVALATAAVSPRQNYALGIDVTGRALLLDLPSGAAQLIAGAADAPDRIAISPGGGTAVLYSEQRRSLQLLSGLPGSPAVTAEVDLSALAAALTAVAASDRAGVALLGTGTGVYAVGGGALGSPVLVSSATSASAIAFIEDSLDAVVADAERNEILLIRDVTAGTRSRIVAGERDGIVRPSALAADRNGRVFVSMSDAVAIVSLDAAPPLLLPCPCRPTDLRRLSGGAVFRLNDASDGPMYLLDASASEPRLWFVPMDRKPAAEPPALFRARGAR